MFEHIVAIVDGSETSRYAISTSITVARENADELMFCVTIDPELNADGVGITSLSQMAMKLGEQMLNEALARAHASGMPLATGRILQDEQAHGVVSFAQTECAGLIVLGLAPLNGILRPFIRSLVEEILRETTIPLLVVRRPALDQLNRRILVPIVDDDLSHLGVVYAIELAKNFRSFVILLHRAGCCGRARCDARPQPRPARRGGGGRHLR